ncbi:YibE/F-like protein [Pseudoflavonifractor capillosus ATCC 29799]|uniref:YibE/F-like protein n=1 Tax=Pseudoflavonifractor capillosus ATCC 29799 TaxID=411467 RepID=A6P2C0_9FIRM|nr:YibE/F family protein [Pseudoflavonifractor capillosus]EDM97507.1 YibE/F-like protein [Pseudoflavonifractor capillosus ATCC 29799]
MKKQDNAPRKLQPPQLTRGRIVSIAVSLLVLALLVGFGVYLNTPGADDIPTSASQMTFAVARVNDVLMDNAEPDDWTEGRRLGTQLLELEICSGEHKGEFLETYNYLNAYTNLDARENTRLIVRLDYDDDGSLYVVSIFNYDRWQVVGLFVLAFALVMILVGGRKGVKALLGLLFTLACVWFLLLPMMLRGIPPVPATVGIIALTTAASLLLLDGPTLKTLCATLGCVGGVAAAGISAAIVGTLTPLNGFNTDNAEALVLQASDGGLQISGLLVCGILISSMGAVMDVAMAIASSLHELHTHNPELSSLGLFRSGMNIGRDAMGTMANTLILAFAGSSLNTLLLFQVYDYPLLQLLNSDLLSLELLQGIAGSMGIILTVPIVAALSGYIMGRKRK